MVVRQAIWMTEMVRGSKVRCVRSQTYRKIVRGYGTEFETEPFAKVDAAAFTAAGTAAKADASDHDGFGTAGQGRVTE